MYNTTIFSFDAVGVFKASAFKAEIIGFAALLKKGELYNAWKVCEG